MKNLILLLIAVITINSCNRDDENINNNNLTGEWKLVQSRQNFQEVLTTDYSSQNIIFSFQQDNILKVSGGDNTGYNNGSYPYLFLSKNNSNNDLKVDLIQIQDMKWILDYSKTQMKLDFSYLDGPTLIFEKK